MSQRYNSPVFFKVFMEIEAYAAPELIIIPIKIAYAIVSPAAPTGSSPSAMLPHLTLFYVLT